MMPKWRPRRLLLPLLLPVLLLLPRMALRWHVLGWMAADRKHVLPASARGRRGQQLWLWLCFGEARTSVVGRRARRRRWHRPKRRRWRRSWEERAPAANLAAISRSWLFPLGPHWRGTPRLARTIRDRCGAANLARTIPDRCGAARAVHRRKRWGDHGRCQAHRLWFLAPVVLPRQVKQAPERFAECFWQALFLRLRHRDAMPNSLVLPIRSPQHPFDGTERRVHEQSLVAQVPGKPGLCVTGDVSLGASWLRGVGGDDINLDEFAAIAGVDLLHADGVAPIVRPGADEVVHVRDDAVLQVHRLPECRRPGLHLVLGAAIHIAGQRRSSGYGLPAPPCQALLLLLLHRQRRHQRQARGWCKLSRWRPWDRMLLPRRCRRCCNPGCRCCRICCGHRRLRGL